MKNKEINKFSQKKKKKITLHLYSIYKFIYHLSKNN